MPLTEIKLFFFLLFLSDGVYPASATIVSSDIVRVNYDTFTSEYVYLIGSPISDWDSANTACKELVKDGTSWELGAFYTQNAKSILVSSGILQNDAFMGGVVPAVTSTYQMVWTGGRLKGNIVSSKTFSQGMICEGDWCD